MSRLLILGPSRSQEVQQGDSVEIGVFGKYVDPKKVSLSPARFVRTGLEQKIIPSQSAKAALLNPDRCHL